MVVPPAPCQRGDRMIRIDSVHDATGVRRPLRIANFSGALGDWVGAFAAAVQGEPVDVLSGDYLAEITVAHIAGGYCAADDKEGLARHYIGLFLEQLTPELETLARRGMKVVTNAGAFNPAGLAAAARAAIAARGLSLRVACVSGDDLFARLPELLEKSGLENMDTRQPLAPLLERTVAANAYLGGWGIATALAQGADIVICGRVSDASLVTGAAAWWHGWQRDDWDRLAGAVAAGHLIECGAQVAGGNFSGFAQFATPSRIGFPIAEIAADGSFVVTKRAAEGGTITVDTVTAQLLYEIQGPDYLNPDVVLHVDSAELTQAGPDRVRVSGVTGSPAPETTKLGCLYTNGWRGVLYAFATGAQMDAKIAWFERQMRSIAEELALEEYHFDPLGKPVEHPATQAQATIAIRIAAMAADPGELVKLRQGLTSFGLGGMPGFHAEAGPPFARRVDFWPTLVRQTEIHQQVVLDGGRTIEVPPPPTAAFHPRRRAAPQPTPRVLSGRTSRVPLGELIHARAGDKGGNSNLGVWARRPEAWDWIRATLTPQKVATLLGLRKDVGVERHELGNLNGLLFVLRGYFGASAAGCALLDNLGKGVGEFLRTQFVDVPLELQGRNDDLGSPGEDLLQGRGAAEEKIRFTLAQYCHRTDRGDFDGWVELFTQDGTFCMFGREVVGHAALRAFIERDQPPELRGLHLTTDSAITLQGARATVRSNFIFVAGGETAGVVVAAGRYLDTLVPRGDAWLFERREAELVLPVATQRWGTRPA